MTFEWVSHGRQVQYCGKLTLSLGTANVLPCPTYTGSLRGVEHVLIGVNLRISKHFISPKVNRTDRRTSAEGGVRVSALLRRGAAPYADGCE